MNKNLRWKVITILAVLAIFTAVGVYPIVAPRFGINSPSWLMDKQLKLGLDLKGGVHLVLRVITDDALRVETETEMERVREALGTAGVTVGNVTAPDPADAEGIHPLVAGKGFRRRGQAALRQFRQQMDALSGGIITR